MRRGCLCENQVITLCQDIADPLDKGIGIDAIIIDFSKAFDLVPHYRLLTKLAALGLDSSVVVWVREFRVGRTQMVRVGGKLSNEITVTSGVPQWTVLGPLPFLLYVKDIWKNIVSSIRLFAEDCKICRRNHK